MNDIELMKQYIMQLDEGVSGALIAKFIKSASGTVDDIIKAVTKQFPDMSPTQLQNLPKQVQNIKGAVTKGTGMATTKPSVPTSVQSTLPSSTGTKTMGTTTKTGDVISGSGSGKPPQAKPNGTVIDGDVVPPKLGRVSPGKSSMSNLAKGAAAGAAAVGLTSDNTNQDKGMSAQKSPTGQSVGNGSTGTGVRKLTNQEEMELNALAFDIEKNISKNPEYAKMLEPYYAIYGKD